MASLSTFAESVKPIEVTEATPVSTETPATTSETPPPAEETIETVQQDNVSDFILNTGDETPSETIETTTQPVFNLDEEIKKIDRKELLKKVGVTDFAIELDEHLAKGGNAIDYLNAKSIDYNQVSDEELVKEDLRKQFKGFSKEDINRLFLKKYPDLNSDIPEEKDDAELLLRADAYTARQAKITEQQKFQIPQTPILQKNEAYEKWEADQQVLSQSKENVVNFFNNHEATKALNESKRVTINLGEGVEPFNFNINKPEVITQSLTDGGKTFTKLITTETGEPDVKKQQLITMFAFNPQKFMQDIFSYGLQMGERKKVVEGQNARLPNTPVHSITGEKPTYRTGTYAGGTR